MSYLTALASLVALLTLLAVSGCTDGKWPPNAEQMLQQDRTLFAPHLAKIE